MDSNKSRQATAEHRKFPRISASCGMSFRAVEDDDSFGELRHNNSAVMNNISGGGISFLSAKPVPVGQMLALELQLPGFPMEVISMGKVAWCDHQGGDFEVGVEFWWIGWKDEEAQSQIREFITTSLRKEKH